MLAWATVILLAQTTPKPEDAPVTHPLFNGESLQGWVDVYGATSTWSVRENMIACAGKPAGLLRTERQYENFILELEWQQLQPGGSAGVFVWSDALPATGQPFPRAIEVQMMREPSERGAAEAYGSVLSIQGAHMTPDRPSRGDDTRCAPSESRGKPAGEWNQYRITCREGALKVEVNGKEVSGGYAMTPRKGYVCLGCDGSAVNFRNLRIAELPASKTLKQEQVAERDHAFLSLLNGKDLSGWKLAAGDQAHWQQSARVLHNDGKGDVLWTEQAYQDFELIIDWDWSNDNAKHDLPMLLVRGGVAPTRDVVGDAVTSGWNRLSIAMAGDYCTIQLNGITVLDRVVLPGVNASGAIGIRPQGSDARFTNLFVRAR